MDKLKLQGHHCRSLWSFTPESLVIVYSALLICQVHCHLLSSNINLELLATQSASKMQQYISGYINTAKESETMTRTGGDVLHRYLKDYEIINRESNEDRDRYLSNPVNEYLLIKRTADWNRIRELMLYNNSSSTNLVHSDDDETKFLSILPTYQDVGDAAIGLVQLQTTYNLATRDLADGKLLLSTMDRYLSSNPKMTAGDCWELGRQAYLIGEDEIAMSWMEESIRMIHQEPDNDKTTSLEDILKYYAFSSFNRGQKDLASKLTRQLIQLLNPEGQMKLKKMFEIESELRASTITNTGHSFHDQDYKALCRGEKLIPPSTESQLHCSYTGIDELSAFMKLQPLKREQISLNPPITVFYDVISDTEIEILKSIAQPKFEIGLNSNSQTGENRLSQRRIYLHAVLRDEDNHLVKKISRRMEEFSGLELTHPGLAMSLYGVGGHFVPHWDYTLNETLIGVKGNPIATCLVYLNDVEFGGSTVFPLVKAGIKPVKGSAALWYNLLPNGQGNVKTRHAGCPVLAGYKMVIGKPFGYKAQAFRRPCRLNYDDELY